MTLDRAITLIVSAALTWVATYFLGVAPVAEEKAIYQERASRRLSKVYEKKRTIATLERDLADARAFCETVPEESE